MKRSLLVGAAVLGSLTLSVPVTAAASTGGPATGPAAARTAPVPPSARASAIQHASDLARSHGSAIGLDSAQALLARDVVADASGAQHVRFERTWHGLPVVGGDLVVHTAADGSWAGDSVAARSVTPASSRATVSASRAAQLLAARYPGGTVSTPTAVIDALAATPQRAWRATVTGVRADQTPIADVLVVDAGTGAVRLVTRGVKESTGHSLYVGTVSITTAPTSGGYTLTDNSRGGMWTIDMKNRQGGNGSTFVDADDVWGDGTVANRQTAAVDAHFGAEKTWDFYKNTYGRVGIRNDGVGSQSRVHYGKAYNNAFWSDSCFCMTYGDGAGDKKPLVALDVAGHEMSHGITSATANLNYSGDAGGLNEATSDIFGTMVEFTAGAPADPGDYLIGEKIDINGNGTPLRYMDKPSKDGVSVDCWSTSVGGLDPHYSSGVGNHFFYLLAEGSGAKTVNGVAYNSPTCNGASVPGIGRDAASAIWYRALTVYMTSTTTYPQARQATLKAATDLYGASSSQYSTVAATWSAVSVN